MHALKFKNLLNAFNRRFGFLLFSLFALIVIAAFSQDTLISDELFLIALCLTLIASLSTLDKRAHHFPTMLGIGIVTLACNVAGYLIPGHTVEIVAAAVNFGFLLWVDLLLISYIFVRPSVTLDTIMGAACLYVLIGITFGFAYLIIDAVYPGSFHYEIKPVKMGAEAFLDRFFYYSMVTLTTVGYGDMMPVSQPARYFSVIETLLGQLYMTILLARLVGLHLTQGSDKGDGPQSAA